jgi:short-subunit dehydrogenase
VGVAVITGATAGIGAAFARALAAERYDLVLVARDGARLAGIAEELAERHGVNAVPLVADLATREGCATVEARLADPTAPVDILVNNAGKSLHRSLLRASPEDLDGLLALNVGAVQRLTRAVLPGMVERRGGDVVNVSSVAGFFAQPGSTYSASKAWVTNFSQSTGLAVRRYGVRVMALCPGYTRTEFHERAGADTGKIPGWLWLSADDVVRAGLRDLRRGRLVSVPDWRYKTAVFGARYGPRWLVQRARR